MSNSSTKHVHIQLDWVTLRPYRVIRGGMWAPPVVRDSYGLTTGHLGRAGEPEEVLGIRLVRDTLWRS